MPTAYIAASDLVTRYGKRLNQALSGADGTVADATSVTSNTRLLAAISFANAMVDFYVIGKHAPADVSSNPVLTDCAMTLAWHKVLESYRTEMADAHTPARDEAMRTLRDVAKGLAGGGLGTLTFEPEDRTFDLAPPRAVEIAGNATTTETTWTQSDEFQSW